MAKISTYIVILIGLTIIGCGRKATVIKARQVQSHQRIIAAELNRVSQSEWGQALAQAYKSQAEGDFQYSELLLREIISINKDFWLCHFLLGQMEADNSAKDKALHHFYNSLFSAPDRQEVRSLIYLAIAQTFESNHDPARARQHYRTALELDPLCLVARQSLQNMSEPDSVSSP